MRLFPWTMFKALNNMQFLRISYLILVGVPIVASIQSTDWGSFFGELPKSVRLGYFSSLLLSVAHMLYQGYCPQIIKRFESPNDLYRDMLEIKALQVQHLPEDEGFSFSIEHCRTGFDQAKLANWGARLLCGILYLSGLGLVAGVVFKRSLVVLGFDS